MGVSRTDAKEAREMLKTPKRPLLLWGKMVDSDGRAAERYVLVRDGRIVEVSRRRPAPELVGDAIAMATEGQDWIFPGLIDLHTHAAYNVLPLWRSPIAPFDNRHQWREDDGYKMEVRGAYAQIKFRETALTVFAELQAIAGGTTTLEQPKELHGEADTGELVLCRSTATPADLLLNPKGRIHSVVDFFRPDKGKRPWKPEPTAQIKQYLSARTNGTLVATLAHVAEGRSGFGSDRAVDAYTRREFEAFKKHSAFRDVEAVRQSPLAIIHGSGIDAKNEDDMRFLRERKISIVWSPVSNLLLYGDTIDVEALLDQGINVALGSDWSPSGSKHVWDEAKFAHAYVDAIGSPVSDRQIFRMVTTNAAKCLNTPHIGRIEPGGLGDFFILRSPLDTDNPLEVFLRATDRDVLATIIGGRPIYGQGRFLKQFGMELQPLPRREGSAVADKAVHLPRELKVDLERDITELEDTLKKLDPPVKRSNLLASADKPYRRRVQRLRARIEDLGWNVQAWRKKGPAALQGSVPVKPDAVRVWCGYRTDGLDGPTFRKALGRNFLPFCIQSQPPLGLTAYLPAILPDDRPDGVPDEIALVFYESQDVYRAAAKTTIGRIYGALHGTVFSRNSTSSFPSLLEDAIKPNTPYYLLNQEADWYLGTARVLVGTRRDLSLPTDFRARYLAGLKAIQKRPSKGLDGAITTVTDDWAIYWEHWTEEGAQDSVPNRHVDRLRRELDVVLLKWFQPRRVPTWMFERYDGMELQGGECLIPQFTREKLLPW